MVYAFIAGLVVLLALILGLIGVVPEGWWLGLVGLMVTWISVFTFLTSVPFSIEGSSLEAKDQPIQQPNPMSTTTLATLVQAWRRYRIRIYCWWAPLGRTIKGRFLFSAQPAE